MAFALGLLVRAQAVEWRRISPNPTSEDLICAAAGNGAFVVGGANLWTSTNAGADWRMTVPAGDGGFTAIVFANGKFVATRRNSICSSSDGLTWTSHPMPGFWDTVTFGNGRFLAGSGEGAVAISVDGEQWGVTHGVGETGLSLASYGNGIFLLRERSQFATIPGPPGPGGFPGQATMVSRFWVLTSPDGTNWTRFEAVTPYPTSCFVGCTQLFLPRGLVFANGKFVLSSVTTPYGSTILSSSDGVNWTWPAPGAQTPPPSGAIYYKGGNFIQLSDGVYAPTPQLSVADTNFTWTAYTLPLNESFPKALAYDGTNYVVVGTAGFILRGSSLNALERIDSPEKTAAIASVAVHGDTFFAVGRVPNRYFHIVSTNAGRTFSNIRDTSTLNGITLPMTQTRYADGKFVAVGAGIKVSTNAIDWTYSLYDTSKTLYDVEYANGLWVAVGEQGTIHISTNAIDFTTVDHSMSGFSTLGGVAYGNGKWVAVGGTTLLESSDGVTWTANTDDPNRPGLQSVAFGNGKFVAAASGNRVYVSSPTGWSVKEVHQEVNSSVVRVAFAQGYFVALAAKTYVSSDGENWTVTKVGDGVVVTGANASDGRLWACGEKTFLFEMIPTLEISPVLRVDGRIVLEFDSPTPANFRVYSAANSPSEPFLPGEQLLNAQGRVSWTNNDTSASARFFLLKKE